jgi:hypothetical protein
MSPRRPGSPGKPLKRRIEFNKYSVYLDMNEMYLVCLALHVFLEDLDFQLFLVNPK